MKKCPFCAEDIQDAAVICRYCGSDLTKGPTRKCPFCSATIPVTARVCPSCAEDVSSGASGTAAASSAARPTSSAPQRAGSGLGIAALVLGIAATVMPYFAAVFLVPAAFVCGLMALRRGQKGLGVAGMTLAVLGLMGVLYVSNEISRVTSDPFAPNSLTSAGPAIVTLAEYQQIREGMTYAEVRSIIGAAGEEVSRSDLAGYTTVMYSWSNPNGSNMNAMFQNGGLVNKAQFGLR